MRERESNKEPTDKSGTHYFRNHLRLKRIPGLQIKDTDMSIPHYKVVSFC